MLLLDELRVELEGYRKDMKELYEILDVDKAKSEIAELQEQSGRDGFWDDIENSQKVMQTIKHHEATVESYNKLNEKLEDALTMIELAMEEEDDEDTAQEIKRDADRFKKELEAMKLTTPPRASMTARTPFSRSTRAQAVQRRRAGRRCFSVCTICGRKAMALR